jgi:uncharacterized repeat protein (TIGR01451 family)
LLGSYGKLPLSFEANQGQSDPRVKFLARARRYTLFLTADDAVLAFRQASGRKEEARTAVLRYKLLDANPTPAITPLAQLPGKSNYLIGKDPTKWHTNVPNYAKVRYEQAYPGIDLLYYGNQGLLEFDFQVAPGANPRTISLAIDGARQFRLDEQGNLVMDTSLGAAHLLKPRAYQDVNGKIQTVASRYVLEGTSTVRFELGPYDRSRTLVIDPVLEPPSGHPILGYSTYLGGSDYDFGDAIAVDSSGQAYVVGITSSSNFPITTFDGEALHAAADFNNSDVFVAKFSADGSSLIYCTLLGGTDNDYGLGIAVDTTGNAYVTGETFSTEFPTTPGAFQLTKGGGSLAAFVTKLNPEGSGLVYSTYLRGIQPVNGTAQLRGQAFGDTYAQAITVDSSGQAYLTGSTDDFTFPVTANAWHHEFGGSQDAFVTVLNSSGSALIYSTFVGWEGWDDGQAIAVDSQNYAYVTGCLDFATIPESGSGWTSTNGGFVDAFVAKWNVTTGALVYGRNLGGSAYDEGYGITVDSYGRATVTGDTYSDDFPTTSNAIQPVMNNGVGCGAVGGDSTLHTAMQECVDDGFVTKLDASGANFIYSTYLGGTDYDWGENITSDASGNVYVTGGTYSCDFPTAKATQGTHGDCGVGVPLSQSQVAQNRQDRRSRAHRGASAFRISQGEVDPCDAFVTRIDDAGSSLVFSTYLGGHGFDEGFGIALDGIGNSFVTGDAYSTDFPTANPFQEANAGEVDTFVTKIAGPSAIRYLPEFTAHSFPENDDDSIGPIQIGFTINFFGQEYSSLYVNNNGNVTFDEPLGDYTPYGLTTSDVPVIIAPFFADVMTTNPGSSVVTYGTTTIDGHRAFGVNWVNVGYFYDAADKLISAQLVLIEREDVQAAASETSTGNFDIEFNYDKVQWETGDFSGGSGGLGGYSAHVGYSNGTGLPGTFFELTGSGVNGAFLDNNPTSGLIHNNINSTYLGRYYFQVRGGGVQGADLAITKTAPSIVSVGGTLTYHLTVVNDGPADVPAATVHDALPETLTFVSATASQGNCTANTTITCNLGELANGASATVTIVTTATSAGEITNTAEVSGNLPDSDPSNNTASAVTEVGGDLSFEPPSLDFEGNVDILCPAKRVTVQNVRETSLTITNVTVDGPFNIDTDCRSRVLAAGGTCLVTVLFLPQAVGTFPGTVNIFTNVSAGPTVLAVTGHATPACRMQAGAQASTVVRGTNSTTFNIAESNPSCFTSRVNLNCADQSPATCSFNSRSSKPTQATLTVGNLAALMSNDLNFRAVGSDNTHSVSLNLAVHVSDFSLAASTSRATVTGGQSATYNLSLQSINGLRGRVNLSCTGAPMGATCSVTPASLTLDGAAATSFSVKVTTTARSLGAPGPKPQGLPPFFGPWIGLAGVWWLMALALLAGLAGSRRSGRRALLGLTAALLFVLLWAACAGGSNSFRQTLSTGTPAGTYSLTLSATYPAGQGGAASDLSHSTSLTLLVQ